MRGHLPTWLADWLGIDSSPGADAAMWQLDSSWSWPPWATLLLIVGVVLWTVALYARESTSASRGYLGLLVALRLAVLALLLIMIAQWAVAWRLTGRPSIALVVDRSASMGLEDHYDDTALVATLKDELRQNNLGPPTRLNQAKLLATRNDGQLLNELAERYELDVYLVAGGIERLSRDITSSNTAELQEDLRELTAEGDDSNATRLGDAVEHVLEASRGMPPAGIILLTDGITTEGAPLDDAAQRARRKGVPIFSVGLGSDTPPSDIELADVLVDDVVFVGDLVRFELQIKSMGLEGDSARIVLRRDGQSEPVAQQEIVLGAADEAQTLALIDRPTEPGDIAYSVEVEPREDEINPDNNRQRRVVAVRDEKIRVLLAFAYPSFEFRFLKSLLERDKTIELATHLQEADPEHAEQDKTALRALPIGRDELFDYDVLVLGDLNPELLPRSVWQNVRAFVVEKGGGVALIAGPRYVPRRYHDLPDVAALVPFDLDSQSASATDQLPAGVTRGFIVEPTRIGFRSPSFQLGDTSAETEQIWHNLAPLYWLVETGKPKPGAQVLAVGPQSEIPIISFQYVGPGRVLFHAIDSTWRWRIGEGDKFFARYWVQSIRHLARGALAGGRGAELVANRREYERGEPIELRVRFFDQRLAPSGDDDVTVLVESAGQPRRRVTLSRNPSVAGVYEGRLSDLPQGRYDVVLATPQLPGNPPAARFSLIAPPGEFARTAMDRAALTAAAKTTGGEFYTIADAEKLLDDLPAGRRVPIETLPPVAIWNQWWLLAALVACLTSEWILRKRKGML